jgi:hypothetical protein
MKTTAESLLHDHALSFRRPVCWTISTGPPVANLTWPTKPISSSIVRCLEQGRQGRSREGGKWDHCDIGWPLFSLWKAYR